MTVIHLSTNIDCDVARCFDLARSVDVHIKSASKTRERAIAGRSSGLCEAGDVIVWEAIHFGITQRLTVQITKMEKPFFFEDRMIDGAFKSMRHEHHFKEVDGKTIMVDKFEYTVPFGIFGKLFNVFVLRAYMKRFLRTRNSIIKSIAAK